MYLPVGFCFLAVTFHCMQAFLLDPTCTVSALCSCTAEDIRCDSRNLSDVPAGFTSDISASRLTINFEHVPAGFTSDISASRLTINFEHVPAGFTSDISASRLTINFEHVPAGFTSDISASRLTINFEHVPAGFTSDISASRLMINFEHVPAGFRSDISASRLTINFEQKAIKTIKANAFKNLLHNNSSERHIRLLLGFNSIDHIQDGAFNSLNETLEYIDLRSNRLIIIPQALTEVSSLGILRLEGNPISHFDGNTFAVLGTRLIYASLGFENFKTWPKEMHLLRSLEHLGLYNIPFPVLDIDAFRGFENTLKNLSIHHSKLWKIPAAICRLKSLEILLFENNLFRNLDHAGSSVFEPCNTDMPTVKTLALVSNNLNYFPDVFKQFPNLNELRISGNGIRFIDTKTIQINISDIPINVCQVQSLFLDNNPFTRIPISLTVLGIMPSVFNVLSLKSNRIATIELWDIAFLHLTELYLNDNPLLYITPFLNGIGALTSKSNVEHSLRVLRLDNTSIGKIPESVVGFTNLVSFGISGRPIECTCSMTYLKNRNVTRLQVFDGVCEYSTETLKHYIQHDLQRC